MAPYLKIINALTLCLLMAVTAGAVHARPIGGQFPAKDCPACSLCKACDAMATCGCAISKSEGNLKDGYRAGVTVKSAFGPTLDFALSYNSMAADGSQSRTATVMGYGWTHSYNILLFSQLGHMFRMDAEGRVSKYTLGAGGSFTATAGYFETLVRNANGTFTLRQKDGTTFDFALIAGTPFLIQGPVYRLTKITDRNGNVTSLAYSGGKLVTVSDTYGRQISLGYAGNQLATITDPLGRVTRLAYALNGTLLSQITDPEGHSVQYQYNELAQLTQKIDKDGRVFTYTYANGEPAAVSDGAGDVMLALANPSNWADDETLLASTLMRVYLASTTTRTDGRSNTWNYDYDSDGYVTRVVAPDGATTRYSYDAGTLQIASETDANNHSTSYQYDGLGNLIRRTDAMGNVTTFAYEPVFSMVTSMTDANGRVTRYNYDAHGNRIQETDALGGTRSWTYDSHGNVLSDKDKNGNVTVYSYDAFGDRAQTTDALGDVSRMSYDAVGNLIASTNARGFTTRYQYDGLNRPVKQTDALNQVTQSVYDGQGNRIELIDRDGNATTYHYDLRQRLTQTTDALNATMRSTYDGNDNRASMTDQNGQSTAYQFDMQNRLITTIDALGNVSSRRYDAVSNRLSETDANGHTTNYQYDALNRLTTTTDAQGDITQMRYDMVGLVGCAECTGPVQGSPLVTEAIDAEGKVSYFKYDGLDRLIIENRKQNDTADLIDSDDAVTRYRFDAQGNRVSVTEANGNTTSYAYDALNRQAAIVNAAGDTTRVSYDENGNLKALTAPNLNVMAYTYDALDRLMEVDDSIGRVANYAYDAVGNRLTEVDGNGNGSTYAYDALYRVIEETDALGRAARYAYDPVGNLLSLTDREGKITRELYDAINRRVATTDALGNVTQYQYDGVGNLLGLTDANGHTTAYSYDQVNRRTQETYADGGVRSFAYDRVGNVKTRTDQKGQVTSYRYSDLYFLLSRSYPASPADNMAYDLSGRMLTAERGGWVVTFAYDGANRVIHTTQNGNAISYVYDVPGRQRTLNYPGGRRLVETSDARTRLGTIDDAGSPPPIVQYQYDLGDRVLMRNYRNGSSANFSYDANNWITHLDHSGGALRIAGFAYDFDNEGHKRFEQKLVDSANSSARSQSYQYDALYRLIDYKAGNLVGSSVPLPSTQTQYSLDPVGNWNAKIRDLVPESRTHSVTNEITQIGAVAVVSDADGNTSADGLYRYTFDEENRLIAVTRKADAATVGQYAYDALGRRIVKIVNPAGSVSTTAYFYDDARIIEEQNGAGITQATYVYGNYVDEVLAMERGGQIYYYHPNSQWSVAAISDVTGNVVERYDYDVYGAPIVLSALGVALPANAWGTAHSAIGNPWLFSGRQFDEESGLYFYRARDYDPIKGRFLERDPLGNADSVNLYEYTHSNPVGQLDAFGLATVTVSPKDNKAIDGMGYYAVGGGPPGLSQICVKVTGECACCHPPGPKQSSASGDFFSGPVKYGIRNIKIEFKLIINVYKAHWAVVATGVPRVYGHEQRHVAMMVKQIDANKQAIETLFSDLEGECKYGSLAECEQAIKTELLSEQNGSRKARITPLIAAGYQHGDLAAKGDLGSGHPKKGVPYDPIGEVKENTGPQLPPAERDLWSCVNSSVFAKH